MKKLLSLVTVMLVTMSSFAAPVDQTTAMQMAKAYLSNEMYAGKIMAPEALNPVLLKAEIGNTKLNKPVYYIYNTSTTYLVVAGDDRAENILMVGDAPLNPERIPDGLQFLLDCYKEQIEFLQTHPNLQVKRYSDANSNMLRAVTYGPLLTAKWDQSRPYYNLCKFTYNNRSYQCVTGCPATSAAMVMYFWKYPASVGALPGYDGVLDIGSYYTNEVDYTYPDLGATTFNWSSMKNTYSYYETGAAATAVATLMRYIGQAENMDYGVTGSGIPTDRAGIIATMFKDWGYKSSAKKVNKGNYTAENWIQLIIDEMSIGRPTVYLGVDMDDGGHAFNVDGYRSSDGKFHVNFGWSGDGDNWYAMDAFTYDGATFNMSQMAIIGIEPPSVPDAVLTVSPAMLGFTGCFPGETYTKTFTVSGVNLRGDVRISSNRNTVTVSPSTLTAAEAQAGATVTVTFQPTTSGNQTAEITVSSVAAESQVVNVSASVGTAPVITVDPASLEINAIVGRSVSKTFNVTGTDLTGSIYLTCTGTGFTINKSMITKSAAAQGTTVTVTYSPTQVGDHTGTVTLTTTGTQAVVELTGHASIVKYPPVMEPPYVDDITETSFAADWSDDTPESNVLSYTLDVLLAANKATETGDATHRVITGINDFYYVVNDLTPGGTYLYKVKALYTDGTESEWSNTEQVTLLSSGHSFVPGDVNHDSEISIADVTLLIAYVLSNGNGVACPICADVNGDGFYTIADVTILIGMVLGGN